jgi:hypothetical protein
LPEVGEAKMELRPLPDFRRWYDLLREQIYPILFPGVYDKAVGDEYCL